MAEAWLEEIYVYAKYIMELRKIVKHCQEKNKEEAILVWEKHTDVLSEMGKSVSDNKILWRINDIVTSVSSVRDASDLADLCENKLIPVVQDYIKKLGKIDVEDAHYRLFSSESGFLTLYDSGIKRYVHSACDPMNEAMMIAQRIYSPKITSYHLWGCGLGYLPYAINILAKGSAKVYVYEKEEIMAKYGYHYGTYDWIEENKLQMIWDPDGELFLKALDENKRDYYITKWGFMSSTEEVQEKLKRVYLNRNFYMEEENSLNINYWSNIRSHRKPWTELKGMRMEKTIMVAAGPSLDGCMEYLRTQKGKKTIVAVGTVFEKLVKADIKPDLVVVLENNALVYKQIEQVEKERIPIVLSVLSYWKIAERYAGDVFFVPISQDERCLNYAKDHNLEVWNSCGTVSLFALQLMVRLQAKEIELIGLDLAFPGLISHASGTAQKTMRNIEEMISVKSVTGDMVYTDMAFDLYRREIEAYIKKNLQVKFRNMSNCGAKIEGTFERE